VAKGKPRISLRFADCFVTGVYGWVVVCQAGIQCLRAVHRPIQIHLLTAYRLAVGELARTCGKLGKARLPKTAWGGGNVVEAGVPGSQATREVTLLSMI
jgi:hypothetical protein